MHSNPREIVSLSFRKALWEVCYILLCPPFNHVCDGFSSFHCIRPWTQRNDWSVPLYLPLHYICSVVNRSAVSAVICCCSITSAGNLKGSLYLEYTIHDLHDESMKLLCEFSAIKRIVEWYSCWVFNPFTE